ncbi:MAG TPA: glycosyl hydrolase, partial [Pilimelia sp.]|nr:glycosyl hydrolase [Pilimelia sp.]
RGVAPPATPGPRQPRPPAAVPRGGAAVKGVANSSCADLSRLRVAWYYNWTLSAGDCAAPGFVPMVAGKQEKTPSAVSAALGRVARGGYRTVLGFNEPNKADQANLSVARAVALWPRLTANPGIRVGSPATSADAQGWFTDFMAQVTARKLRVDFIALHWYGWNAGSCDADAAELERYIRWAERLPGGRPIWLTEWGCMHESNPDRATVARFYAGALAVFARHPRVERYAWYPWNTHNELVGAGGALTPLGAALAKAPARR